MKRKRLFALSAAFLCAITGWTQEKYDWGKVLNLPPESKVSQGHQILHFKSKNKHYSQSADATLFVETYLKHATPLTSDADILRFASDAVTIDGGYLELGVCTAKTINYIAALNPTKKIYGFDSFEGLPEDWVRDDKVFPKETFAFHDPSQFPYSLHNVTLYRGWFRDILPAFKREVFNGSPAAFLHIDCDIYSSTVDVFEALEENIVDGTIIVFDEFYNYPGFERHEFQAFNEFLDRTGLEAEYLAYNIYHEQVAVRIKRPTVK